MKCLTYDDLIHYHSRLLPSEEAAAVLKHARDCSTCGKLSTEIAEAAGRLAPDPAEFEKPEVVDKIMTAVQTGEVGLRDASSFWGAWRKWVLLSAAVCLCAGLVALVWPFGTEDAGSDTTAGLDRWVSFQIFRVGVSDSEQVTRSVAPAEALTFSYTNRAATKLKYLMILAVDEGGGTYWYYPSRTSTVASRSVAIEESTEPQELPEPIKLQLPRGLLRVFAVLSPAALEVSSVESVVKVDVAKSKSLSALERLSIEGTGQHSTLIIVTDE